MKNKKNNQWCFLHFTINLLFTLCLLFVCYNDRIRWLAEPITKQKLWHFKWWVDSKHLWLAIAFKKLTDWLHCSTMQNAL